MVDELSTVALFDTGAAITVISERLAKKLNRIMEPPSISEGVAANGTSIKLIGQVHFVLNVGKKSIESSAFVAKDDQCSADLLLGNDTIRQFANKVSIDYKVREITFDKEIIPIVTIGEPTSSDFSAPTTLPYTYPMVSPSVKPCLALS
ncbi:hypothetical protein ANCDUO_22819 [Ancylostoma duodenale]|uniref:Peptidase A2 domain-containing protein n=1 Tax=Ancylostoma duodenale TaxID=51022 RepID=A0A0C2FK35_9BILA|nr:hypothetical protein ANCDUO_22819 [Ancylostoma duodenale]